MDPQESIADIQPQPTRWMVVRWLLPRSIALCYALAFWSWGVQCIGLVGKDGILPAESLMTAVSEAEQRDSTSYFLEYPTLFRFHCSDTALQAACWAGVIASLLAMAGVLQGPMLALTWVLYLSLAVTGQIFMGYQWDALLLEAGLLILFMAPWRSLLAWRVHAEPPRAAVFLLHWLVFRLMLLSGVVKLWSGDELWENGTALLQHFQTQPIPTPLAWYAHHLPRWMLVWGCWGMYVVELLLPFTMWLGRWGRLTAALGYIALMIGVALTGNYTFFNLLTALLALSLVQDRWWPASLKRKITATLTPASSTAEGTPPSRWRGARHLVTGIAAVLVLFSVIAADISLSGRRITGGREPLSPLWAIDFFGRWVDPWRSVNAYGLFQDMTDERLEVQVEVSEDGGTFFPLPFLYKADEESERPRFVAPYQPRLDWQMWFASLYPGYIPQRDAMGGPMQWFGQFLRALTEGRPSVWALVDEKASLIPKDKVIAARATLWRYHFTTPEERKQTGHWWTREYVGQFAAPIVKRSP